jgi:hypothetical protein
MADHSSPGAIPDTSHGNKVGTRTTPTERVEVRKISVDDVNEVLALHSRDGRTLYGVFKNGQLLCVGGTSKEARDRYNALTLESRMVGESTLKC